MVASQRHAEVDAEAAEGGRGEHFAGRTLWMVAAGLVAVGLLALTYLATRPSRYRSEVRLQIERIGGEERLGAGEAESDFLTRCQLLTSRRLLQRVVDALGFYGKAVLGEADPARVLAQWVSVHPIPHTHVVVVTAEGRDRLFPSRLLEALVKGFRSELAFADRARATAMETRLVQEIHRLEVTRTNSRGAASAVGGSPPSGGAGSSRLATEAGGDVGRGRRLEALLREKRVRLARVRLEEEVPRSLLTVLDGPSPAAGPLHSTYLRGALPVAGGGVVLLLGVIGGGLWVRRSTSGSLRREVLALAHAVDALAHTTTSPPAPVGEGIALPRPFTGDEIASLLAATGGPVDRTLFERALLGVPTLLTTSAGPLDVAIGALLSGLTPEEVVTLRWSQIHLDEGMIQLAGLPPRLVDLTPPVQLLFRQAQKDAREGAERVVTQGDGGVIEVADLDALLLCTAYDAGLDRPERVTAEAIRHTFLAHLVRRGLRLADLPRVAGPLSPAVLAAYGRMAPPGPGLPLERIDLTPPGFRPLEAADDGPSSNTWSVGTTWEG